MVIREVSEKYIHFWDLVQIPHILGPGLKTQGLFLRLPIILGGSFLGQQWLALRWKRPHEDCRPGKTRLNDHDHNYYCMLCLRGTKHCGGTQVPKHSSVRFQLPKYPITQVLRNMIMIITNASVGAKHCGEQPRLGYQVPKRQSTTFQVTKYLSNQVSSTKHNDHD